ncbi:MAG: hypothetical protein V1793_23955 [Pseudomonadota bacterium]
MIDSQKEAILIAFLNEKARYKKLAEHIINLIRDDQLRQSCHPWKETASLPGKSGKRSHVTTGHM